MKVQKLILIALFLGIGTILNTLIPGFFFGMKPDMLLSMMILAIILFADKGNIIIIGLAAGVLSGMTTTIPGGFLPNVIDKVVTSLIVFGLILALRQALKSIVYAPIMAAIGTLISGTVFLSALTLLGGLPPKASFSALFIVVVLPTVALNTVFVLIIFPIIKQIISRTRLKSSLPAMKRG